MRLLLPLSLVLLLPACKPSSTALTPTSTSPPPPTTPAHVDPEPPPPPTTPVAVVTAPSASGCERDVAPVERRTGDLFVQAPPSSPENPNFRGRLRTHTEGPLRRGDARVWVGPNVPAFVPLGVDTAELFLLERDGDLDIALYRDPYDASSCTLGGAKNCRFVIRGFRNCEAIYSIEVGDFFSREDHLELQDLRAANGILYFNEACQSYSKEAGGKCSALVAVDPIAGKLLWRTKHLVSNNRFLVLDRYIITAYGFTSEPHALFVVRRSDGQIMQRIKVRGAHDDLQIDEAGRLRVSPWEGAARFELKGFDGDTPRLVPVGGSTAAKPSKRRVR